MNILKFERHKLQKTRTKNAEAEIKHVSRKPPKFRSWVNEFLREKGLPSEIANEFENRLEDDWRDHEKVLLAAIGNIAKDFKSYAFYSTFLIINLMSNMQIKMKY